MNWLLWKDYRINRLIVFTGLVLLLVPHLIGLYATCREAVVGHLKANDWMKNLGVSCLASLAVSQLTVTLLGGNAIAGERVDRSAEFLASLPFTRKKILASKLLLSLIVTAVIWFNAVILIYLFWKMGGFDKPDYVHAVVRGGINFVVTSLTFFCVAWFLSELISSPAIATCGGLIAPLLVLGGIFFITYLFEIQLIGNTAELCYRTICLMIAPVSFAVGTWRYLCRVEP
jgi:ABC-type transport system involved in multi-copper enzyme maturation permease subunit